MAQGIIDSIVSVDVPQSGLDESYTDHLSDSLFLWFSC